jgi:hypothetical protein
VVELVDRALERDIADRWPDAREMRRSLLQVEAALGHGKRRGSSRLWALDLALILAVVALGTLPARSMSAREPSTTSVARALQAEPPPVAEPRPDAVLLSVHAVDATHASPVEPALAGHADPAPPPSRSKSAMASPTRRHGKPPSLENASPLPSSVSEAPAPRPLPTDPDAVLNPFD